MLAKLLYKSTRSANCTDEDLNNILEAAKRNNQPLDITGVLLYDKTRFIQYLEGPSTEISKLYDKIKVDPRHKSARMVSFGPAKERYFPSWAMGAKSMNSGKINIQMSGTREQQSTVDELLSEDHENHDLAIDWLVKFAKEN